MSQPVALTPAFLDKLLTVLAPLFLTAAGGDMGTAREAVRSTLASYLARNDNQLRLAALVLAFGLARWKRSARRPIGLCRWTRLWTCATTRPR
jgi:hypothetical protein